jgi:hypothetical protein
MTQVSRYGHMLKVTVTAMRMRVRARYRVTGSVLGDSVMASMVGAETTLEIDSPDPPTVTGGVTVALLWKVPLTYAVPFAVATLGAMGAAKVPFRE